MPRAHSRRVSWRNFLRICLRRGSAVDVELRWVQLMIQGLDEDGNGKVTIEDFLQMMEPPQQNRGGGDCPSDRRPDVRVLDDDDSAL